MKKRLLISIIFLLSVTWGIQSTCAEGNDFLPVDDAFHFSSESDNGETIINWDIAEGYYLYRDRIKIEVDGRAINISDWPESKLKNDEYFGAMAVFIHQLSLPIKTDSAKTLAVRYQGCAEAGLCYPPQKKFVQLTETGVAPINEQSTILNILLNANPLYTLLFFLGMGTLTAFAGCSYPMFPILSKIIIGQGEHITRLRGLTLSLAYVLPIAMVYAALGVVAGLLGKNLSSWFQTPIALLSISGVLVFMALSMLGLFEINIPSFMQTHLSSMSVKQKSGSYLGAAIMGFISAFIVSACVVPPMVAATTFIAQSGSVLLGASAMFCFGFGLGLPLILLGLSASWLLPKAGLWMSTLQNVMGLFLISAAIWIVDRIIPAWMTGLLWASLAAGTALWVFKKYPNTKGKAMAGLCSLASIAIVAYTFMSSFQQGHHSDFTYIGSDHELQTVLADSDNKVFLDVYADWCVSCKHLENKVFTQPEIAAQLVQFKKVKLDLSDMDEDKQAMLTTFKLLGPPALLFFSPEDQEYSTLRITGEIDAKQLGKVLAYVLNQP